MDCCTSHRSFIKRQNNPVVNQLISPIDFFYCKSQEKGLSVNSEPVLLVEIEHYQLDIDGVFFIQGIGPTTHYPTVIQ